MYDMSVILNKKPRLVWVAVSSEGAVTYFPTFAVSSAWWGLTSLFGMGRGGTLTLSPPKFLSSPCSLFLKALLHRATLQGALYGKLRSSMEAWILCYLSDSFYSSGLVRKLSTSPMHRRVFFDFYCFVQFLFFGGTCVPERVRVISIARL